MRIRNATKRRVKETAELMLGEFSKPPFNEKVTLNDVLKSLNFYFKIGKAYVMIANNKIAGIVIFKIEQYWEGPVIIIEDLAVKEIFKRQGIGKMLIDKVEAYAKKNKIKAIYFQTDKRSSAVKFYQRQEYKFRKNVISMEKKIKSKSRNEKDS